MRLYYELVEEQRPNANSRMRKHLWGGFKAFILDDPIPVEDGYKYDLKVSSLWKYTNYRFTLKLKK